jgi:hypothetical protein
MITTNLRRALFATASLAVLSGCGANDIASPGTGGNVIINNPPAPTPSPSPTPTPGAGLITPASGCPTIADPQGLTDSGTITGTTGTYRVCSLPARINTSVQLSKIAGLLYRLPGRVDVGTDQGAATSNTAVTLTIDPGVIIFGGTGVSWLAVNRGNKINAVGTAALPIIFTSRDNVLGLNTDNSSGQWGGVVLMGRAPITDCSASGAAPGTVACERQTEGAVDPAVYGGASPTDSSGRISYVQIRYSGYVLSGNSELQSLTTSGTGSGTVLDHIQSVNSSDDGAEFFGGIVNLKYFISVGAEDDNLDTDTGVQANLQYGIIVQRQGLGDAMIEADSDNGVEANTPRQNTRVSNYTFIQRSTNGADLASILLRGGTDYTLVNSILVSPNYPCLRVSRPATLQAADATDAGPPVFRSMVMQCSATPFLGNSPVTNAEVQTAFGAGTNNNSATFTPTLTSLFINGANETAVTPYNATLLNVATLFGPAQSFFEATTYIGAVRDASDTWYKTWTCNSTAADFGTGNTGLCTSLPTT